MGILAYIIVGLIAGFIAKAVMPGSREEPGGLVGTILLGVVGAVIGGWTWNLVLGRPGATGVDIGSIFVAFVGSCILIALLRLFRRSAV
jgi:uncharacterized membrane protein YeaQ/YmgE (transglycosylase-associated protein family)